MTCTPAAPSGVTLASPANGSTPSSTSVTFLWNATSSWGTACSGANNQYSLILDTNSSPSTVVATVGSTTTSNTQNNLTRGTTYYWKVRTSNGQLSADSEVRSFTISGGVSGTVYNDVDGTCSTANPSNLGGLGISWGTDSGTVNANGTFNFLTTGVSPQTLSLTGIPSSYVCSPGCGGCPSKTGTASPSTGNNFFLTQSRSAWWQAVGAGVYAGLTGSGVTVRSVLPTTNTDLIIPGVNSIAALLKASSGGLDLGSGSVNADNLRAVSQYKGKRMDYQFFAAHMGVTSSTQDDLAGDSVIKPNNDPTKDFWFNNGDMSIDQPWTVANGESYVVFVKGDLTINANVTVTPGGFLAIIADGGVTVSPSVTDIQGLYVMDDLFTTESDSVLDDGQLVIEGTVVTWSGVSLGRDLGDSNVASPAEQFVYRTDLITNMPEKMKVFALRWQEVAPGTFGN